MIGLKDLIEQYGPDIKEMYGDLLIRFESEDGEIYGLGDWYDLDPDPNVMVMIKYDLLKEVVGQERADNHEQPFTQDEFCLLYTSRLYNHINDELVIENEELARQYPAMRFQGKTIVQLAEEANNDSQIKEGLIQYLNVILTW